MTRVSIGFVGCGHLAQYMIEGLLTAKAPYEIHLFNRTHEKAIAFAKKRSGLCVHDEVQSLVDASSIIVVATRPADVSAAIAACDFSQGQIVLSVAAGVGLADLQKWSAPAIAVRSLPLACVKHNLSPTALFPANEKAERLLFFLGQVHVLPSEDQFGAISALTGAFFAWLIPLLDHASKWGVAAGLEPEQARAFAVETMFGAAHMAAQEPDKSLEDIWTSLATPGGISEQGQNIIEKRGGLSAYGHALDAVRERMEKAGQGEKS
ncbi:pyrroline-5-carboxylate reductase family protein [Maritalea porphyrae]|uniref:pyrroline-5-carboxylate reductase family protein n=1 Tax=Maritalea porphyrae TaxID=880732 RepID=UPI0022AF2D47|nr:pyrroline-5-carboxylate reductase dimerization domain-containing protein [Maritalea porphyrae]MCZ4272489.1 NAD(P)-binding domain-containing protein [Maritalea porphyrae]